MLGNLRRSKIGFAVVVVMGCSMVGKESHEPVDSGLNALEAVTINELLLKDTCAWMAEKHAEFWFSVVFDRRLAFSGRCGSVPFVMKQVSTLDREALQHWPSARARIEVIKRGADSIVLKVEGACDRTTDVCRKERHVTLKSTDGGFEVQANQVVRPEGPGE